MRALSAILVLLSLCALGCGDEVGTCSDENKARDPVLSGNVVMFGGQAIVNKSCAGGRCHSASAKGALRDGAPAGLDFDLVPVVEADADGDDVNGDGDPYVALTPRQLTALRSRQQEVYDRRDTIWQLVKEFRMPPPAKEFSAFRSLSQIFGVSNDVPCEKGQAYESLLSGESQEVLRNWLACGAPIVESNGRVVVKPETAGEAGWQYPVCEGPVGDGGVSLETLLDGPFSSCAGCHPGSGDPDFTSAAKAVQTVVSNDDEVCDGKPYVTKGDPARSYLYDLVSKDDPGCDQLRMPPIEGMKLTENEIAQVAAWITAGAPTTDADIETSSQSTDASAP